jgi:LysR family hydrogen peroxide-inducible transcriptional activator
MIELKLKDLRYLVAVADSGHFGHAAARCFVSQPTLSAQLRKLEDTLGVQLIERRPRRTCLTPAGEQIAERARSMLADADSIVAMAHAQRDPLAGPLRVALLPTIGPYLLPTVASRLRRTLPRLELMLYEYQTDPMLERVRNGDIDLGILALPVPADGCCTRELYEEPFVLAVPQSHALAKRAQVRMDDLKSQPLLLLEDGHCLRDQALALCARSGVQEKQDFRATSIETLRQMVAVGAGVTLLPALAARGAYGNAKGVTVRPFARPAPGRRIGAIWRKSSGRTAAIAAVCDQIAEQNAADATRR